MRRRRRRRESNASCLKYNGSAKGGNSGLMGQSRKEGEVKEGEERASFRDKG